MLTEFFSVRKAQSLPPRYTSLASQADIISTMDPRINTDTKMPTRFVLLLVSDLKAFVW